MDTVFLTDGSTFLGPYLYGSMDLMRGVRLLREAHGAADVHSIRASDLTEAHAMWRKSTTYKRNR